MPIINISLPSTMRPKNNNTYTMYNWTASFVAEFYSQALPMRLKKMKIKYKKKIIRYLRHKIIWNEHSYGGKKKYSATVKISEAIVSCPMVNPLSAMVWPQEKKLFIQIRQILY